MQCVCVRGWAIGLGEIVCVRVFTWGWDGGGNGREEGMEGIRCEDKKNH